MKKAKTISVVIVLVVVCIVAHPLTQTTQKQTMQTARCGERD